jgi:hypothetical protein
MNAIALALPGHLSAAARPTPTVAATAAPVPTATAVAGLHLLAETCIAQTAELLRLACRRGQLEDAAAAARVALPLAQPHSPHAAMLHGLAEARTVLMTAPEERRLYLLRSADGVSHGVLRLRDNGRIGLNPPALADHWRLHDGNLELCNAGGAVSMRFTLCGERQGLRLYLGERVGASLTPAPAESQACVLEELRCTFTRLAMLDPELLDPFVGLYGAAEMVPTPLPAGAALLLGAANSRLHLLAQALNHQPGVHFDGELLHPQGMQLAEHLPSRSAAGNLHALRSKDPAWFARMVLGRSHDALGRDMTAMAVRGFCMAPSHSDAALDWALDEPALRVVHVVRSNALAAFADMLTEQQINHRGALHFEPERFGRFIEMTQRHQTGLHERLCQRGGETVQVDGSRLNAATLAELLGFLHDAPDGSGFTSAGVPAPAQRVIERFDNPEAVLVCLRALDRMGWAEVEGQVVDPG